jgi:hypothetical protein
MNIARIKKFTIAGTLILIASSAAFGQPKKRDNPYAGLPFKDRVVFGGDFGLSFGTITFIRVAPMLGYRVSDRFIIGGGPSYQYFSDNRFVPKFTSSIYGMSAFGQFVAFNNIFLQAQPEVLNVEDRFPKQSPSGEIFYDRVTIPVLFVGGGIGQFNSSGSGVFVSVLYDIIQDPNSPYPGNAVIRIGGFFGF